MEQFNVIFALTILLAFCISLNTIFGMPNTTTVIGNYTDGRSRSKRSDFFLSQHKTVLRKLIIAKRRTAIKALNAVIVGR